jgi:NAD(P)-dependent dehydrogenase (short-subunit alcohol dehydrogenase family)
VPDFDGKVVLITGGTTGIGLATAAGFIEQGASVIVAGRSLEKGEAAVRHLTGRGGRARFVPTDVTDEVQVEMMISGVLESFGRFDILVNSAGVINRIPLTELAQDDWHTILDTNLKGTYLACKHAAPRIADQGKGAIVNVASYLGTFGARETTPAYGASKAGVVSLTRSLAIQMGPHQVRVNAVCPGFVITPLNEDIILDAPDPVAKEAEMAKSYPLGRLGRPKDVAGAILFLASDDASWITGTTLLVDGGLRAH